METNKPIINVISGAQPAIEQKNSVKITKNTKGYNYEFRIVAESGVSIWDQVDEARKQVTNRVDLWSAQDQQSNFRKVNVTGVKQ